jgi:D-glycero-alpha-D-manno-heptose-7-phosphate kinase
MSVIFSRAPLRVSLGGGGTDLPSYYRQDGGLLVSGAIDKYVYMLTHTIFQRRYRLKYSQFEEVDDPSEIRHPILRESLVRHWNGDPLEVSVIADVPAGTGLGSSGSFTVCFLKALALARRVAIPPGRLAEDACEIEIDVLGEPTGKQDQYVSAHGGICAYTFHRDGSVDVEPLSLSRGTLDRLRNNLLLFYTGEARAASAILADQVTRTESGDAEMRANLDRTKAIGHDVRALLERGEVEQFGELMHEHWENKLRRSPGMATERIDHLYTLARRSGVLGGKVVGAGGGGFLLVYARRPDDTRQAMAAANAQELRFDFEFQGCYGVEYT